MSDGGLFCIGISIVIAAYLIKESIEELAYRIRRRSDD